MWSSGTGRRIVQISLDVKSLTSYYLDIKILDGEKIGEEARKRRSFGPGGGNAHETLRSPTTKILADAHVELLRGRRLRRRPKTIRAN